MAGEPVARRYAQALLEIGRERQDLDTLRDQVAELGRIFEESKPFRTALMNPSVTLEERRKIIEALAERRGWDEVVANVARLMLDNDRFGLLPTVADELGRMVDKEAGRVRARVTSASELDESQKDAIEDVLSQMTGKQVLVETDTDPSLLGGVVARIGSMVYDGSVKHQIERLRSSILAEV
ncbi:MAG: ATP synthase F1 subunit delta [Persicimonas sp.]